MSCYQKIKLLLLGVLIGILLVQVLQDRPAQAVDREQIGRYQIATAVHATENAVAERTYVLDTASGSVKRIQSAVGQPTAILVLGGADVF